jgi:pyruvate-ferredoxin/flavodoxin oxidoreductase
MLIQADEQRAEMLMKSAREDVDKRWNLYKQMAAIQYKPANNE